MKNWIIIQIFIYLILFCLGIYFYVTTKWVGSGKYFIGGENILGWIVIIALLIYFVDRVIIKNK